ncbi:MAG TPA: type II toxin-antitoxin system VapC family toxin [Chloroflexota bacterium]|nr:type II toxin-antitoxin system VapC family toxin [Chloroflexota bacterium]
MRLLLDTHAVLWWLAGEGLSEQAQDAIAHRDNYVALSAVSAWEIAIKKALNKLSAPDDLADQLADGGIAELPVRIAHALLAGALPRHHDDPFDRMLVAQAQVEGLTLVTRDSRFRAYDIPTLAA